MDIARPDQTRRKRIRRTVYGVAGLTAILLITVGVSRLKPAAPGVERSTVWIDSVKRGPMLRDVRGQGTLVPWPRTSRSMGPRFTASIQTVDRSTPGAAGFNRDTPTVINRTAVNPTTP